MFLFAYTDQMDEQHKAKKIEFVVSIRKLQAHTYTNKALPSVYKYMKFVTKNLYTRAVYQINNDNFHSMKAQQAHTA